MKSQRILTWLGCHKWGCNKWGLNFKRRSGHPSWKSASVNCLRWRRSILVVPAGWPKIALLNRGFESICWFSCLNNKTQSSLKFLQSGPQEVTKSYFSGLTPVQWVLSLFWPFPAFCKTKQDKDFVPQISSDLLNPHFLQTYLLAQHLRGPGPGLRTPEAGLWDDPPQRVCLTSALLPFSLKKSWELVCLRTAGTLLQTLPRSLSHNPSSDRSRSQFLQWNL